MNVNNLNDTSKKIYELLISLGIKENEILSVIENCYSDFKNNYVIDVEIEELYFNSLRDILWYNIERNEHKFTLEDFGSKFITFMNLCNNNSLILNDDIHSLFNELNDIKKIVNDTNTYLSSLTGNDDLFDDNSIAIKIIDNRHKKLEQSNQIIGKHIYCHIYESLSCYKMKLIKINALIDSLLFAIQKAERNKSYIKVKFI